MDRRCRAIGRQVVREDRLTKECPRRTPLVTCRRSLLGSMLAWQIAPAGRAEEASGIDKESSANALPYSVVFPSWFAGDWACVAELYKATANSGEVTLADAVPGAQEGLFDAQARIGQKSAMVWERRIWEAQPGLAEGSVVTAGAYREIDMQKLELLQVPISVLAAAEALGGRNVTATLAKDLKSWDVVSAIGADPKAVGMFKIRPSNVGSRWRLRVESYSARLDPQREGTFRSVVLFGAQALDGSAVSSVPGVRVETVYRKVLEGDAPSGVGFRLMTGTIDSSRKYILQAIQTVTILPPVGGVVGLSSQGQARNEISLATFKTRLILSPMLPLKPE